MPQRDGKRCVGLRIVRSQSRQCESESNGLFLPVRFARTNKAMVRLKVCCVCRNGRTERLGEPQRGIRLSIGRFHAAMAFRL